MVNSIGLSNVSFGAVPQATTNAREYMQAPSNFTSAHETDTVEVAGKKKSNAVKKGIIGIIAGVAIAAAALYAGVKTGKLTKVENASKWTDKLQNLAFEGGSYVKKGVDWAGTKLTSLKPAKSEKQFTDQEASILKRVAEGIKNDVHNGNIDPACWADLL